MTGHSDILVTIASRLMPSCLQPALIEVRYGYHIQRSSHPKILAAFALQDGGRDTPPHVINQRSHLRWVRLPLPVWTYYLFSLRCVCLNPSLHSQSLGMGSHFNIAYIVKVKIIPLGSGTNLPEL